MMFARSAAVTLLTLATLLVTPVGRAQAQNVQVVLDDQARLFLGGNVTQVEQQLSTEVARQTRALLGQNTMSDFLQESANAQSLVNKGLSADYASNHDGLLMQIAGAVAMSSSHDPLSVQQQQVDTQVPVASGAQLSLLVGYNLADVDLPRLTLFVHGLAGPLSFSEFSGDFYNFGASAQFNLTGPRGTSAMGWGGIAVTGGVEVSRMELSIVEDGLSFTTFINGVDLSTDGAAGVRLEQSAVTVPLELTTNVTLAHVVTLYGGGGVDFSVGKARLFADLESRLSAESPVGAASAGSVQITLDDAEAAEVVTFRVIGGVQANFGPVRLFSQINYRPSGGLLSLSGGLRITV